jgi:hypothetical protein
VFPVGYEPNLYMLFRRNSVFKGLSYMLLVHYMNSIVMNIPKGGLKNIKLLEITDSTDVSMFQELIRTATKWNYILQIDRKTKHREALKQSLKHHFFIGVATNRMT